MKRRQYTDEELEVLARIFKIDTRDAFRPITDEEIKAKTEEIYPPALWEGIKEELYKKIEKIIIN